MAEILSLYGDSYRLKDKDLGPGEARSRMSERTPGVAYACHGCWISLPSGRNVLRVPGMATRVSSPSSAAART